MLACLANRVDRWSNAVPDDLIDRLTGRTEIREIVHSGRYGTQLPQIVFDITANREVSL